MTNPEANERPQALLFDFMGTCLDWHSSIKASFLFTCLDLRLSNDEASSLAMSWRLRFFEEYKKRTDAGLAPEDIDVVHRRTLD